MTLLIWLHNLKSPLEKKIKHLTELEGVIDKIGTMNVSKIVIQDFQINSLSYQLQNYEKNFDKTKPVK